MLAGWTTRRLADGVGLFPPGGIRDGSVRIRDRRRPLRSVREVLEPTLTALGEVRERGAIERLTTHEGEYAALTTTRLATGEHTLGLIFGDDFYTRFDVFTTIPDAFGGYRELARDLVSRYAIGLGSVRMRRPYYQPPRGWTGYPRGLATIWYPSGFPAQPTALTVLPAMPLDRPVDGLSELDLYVGPAPEIATSPYRTGLFEGTSTVTMTGSTQHVRIQLRDTRFGYRFRLDTTSDTRDEHVDVLDRLIASLEPIPTPRLPSSTPFSYLAY
jgi:hypothetical protein